MACYAPFITHAGCVVVSRRDSVPPPSSALPSHALNDARDGRESRDTP
jgi:hypothetical protein